MVKQATGTSEVIKSYGEIDVGNNRKLRIALCKYINEFKGKTSEYEYLDVRQMYEDTDGIWKHGKGFTVSIKDGDSIINQIIEALNKAKEDIFKEDDN
jgi:hypothetical protein